jgi:hypothetical protein
MSELLQKINEGKY